MGRIRERFAAGLEWPIVLFLGGVHLLALVLCVLFPSWQGVGVLLLLYLVTGLGVTLGYHRRLTHQSFQATPALDALLAILGLLSGEGPPLFWVTYHRKHHAHSDGPGDPHRPGDGFWWAHGLWMLPRMNNSALGVLYKQYAPDLARKPFYLFLERSYFFWHLGLAAALWLGGWAVGGWWMGMSFLAYGYFLRMVVVLHATWLVNSAAHCWGYRSYATRDESRNNVVVALLSHGEGWHNNHHYSQVAANHGHRWWEVDLTFLCIVVLALLSRLATWLTGGRVRLVHQVRYYDASRHELRTWFRSPVPGAHSARPSLEPAPTSPTCPGCE